jgi:hypothetical protein
VKLWQLTALIAAVMVASCYLAHLMPPGPLFVF